MKKSIKLIISGNVQGVGLREHVRKQAEKLNVQGTIQNAVDGTVVIFALGPDEQLEELLDVVYKGTAKSSVQNVIRETFTTSKDFRGVFRVIGEDPGS